MAKALKAYLDEQKHKIQMKNMLRAQKEAHLEFERSSYLGMMGDSMGLDTNDSLIAKGGLFEDISRQNPATMGS
jgi:hypothetical protein